jgi:hypothetical protein
VATSSPRLALYNPSLGGLPQSQGWLAWGPPLGAASVSAPPGTLRLNSMAGAGLLGGWSSHQLLAPVAVSPLFPALDAAAGVRVQLTLAIRRESHSSPHRAGFALTLLGSDGLGIELGFWTHRIWSQRGGSGATLFTRHPQEQVARNTTAQTRFDLLLLGQRYLLLANNRPILQGLRRSYAAFDPASNGLPLPYNPYRTPSFLALGDASRSAAVDARLGALNLIQPVVGSEAADALTGGPEDDLLQGRGGADTLDGAGGADVLIGGAGADVFVVAPGQGVDTLVDVVVGSDRLQVSRARLPGLQTDATGTRLAAGQWARAATVAAAARSRAPLVAVGGALYANSNGTAAGFGGGGLMAHLAPAAMGSAAPRITAGSFVVVE